MNHDATHCADYEINKCPRRCYRAQLTQELRERTDLDFRIPFSWAHFKQTKECQRRERNE